jgi:hypothetical protein
VLGFQMLLGNSAFCSSKHVRRNDMSFNQRNGYFLLFILILFLLTCHKNATKPEHPEYDDPLWFQNISETLPDSPEMISDDENDWGEINQFYFLPAYPNPTYNILVSFSYFIPFNSHVKLFILDKYLDTTIVLLSGKYSAGN